MVELTHAFHFPQEPYSSTLSTNAEEVPDSRSEGFQHVSGALGHVVARVTLLRSLRAAEAA